MLGLHLHEIAPSVQLLFVGHDDLVLFGSQMVPNEPLVLFAVDVYREFQIVARSLFGQTGEHLFLERSQLLSVHLCPHPTHVQPLQVLHSSNQLKVDGLVERKCGVQNEHVELLQLEQKVEPQSLVLGVESEREEARTSLGYLVQKRLAQLNLSQAVNFDEKRFFVWEVVVIVGEISGRFDAEIKVDYLDTVW